MSDDRSTAQKVADLVEVFESLRFQMNIDESVISQRGMRTLAQIAVQVIEEGIPRPGDADH